jgi:hypothetical protein
MVTAARTARLWELRRDDRPDDMLVPHAEVLSVRRLDRTGAEIPMETAQLLF